MHFAPAQHVRNSIRGHPCAPAWPGPLDFASSLPVTFRSPTNACIQPGVRAALVWASRQETAIPRRERQGVGGGRGAGLRLNGSVERGGASPPPRRSDKDMPHGCKRIVQRRNFSRPFVVVVVDTVITNIMSPRNTGITGIW